MPLAPRPQQIDVGQTTHPPEEFDRVLHEVRAFRRALEMDLTVVAGMTAAGERRHAAALIERKRVALAAFEVRLLEMLARIVTAGAIEPAVPAPRVAADEAPEDNPPPGAVALPN